MHKHKHKGARFTATFVQTVLALRLVVKFAQLTHNPNRTDNTYICHILILAKHFTVIALHITQEALETPYITSLTFVFVDL